MFTIGDFANLGRVSIRMLRHYDSIGVLSPAEVDPVNGYRRYTASQLSRLNRVLALKDLGFTLAQVSLILQERVDAAELRGMLRLRRAELQEQLRSDAARLTAVEARLRIIESEGTMNTADVILKPIGPVRVAEIAGKAATFRTVDIGPVIQSLYPRLMQQLSAAGVAMAGPGIAYYEPVDSEDSVVIHAAATVAASPAAAAGFDAAPGFDIVDLAAVPLAATLIHHGTMDTVEASYHTLARWIEENGYRPSGFAREFYLDYDPEHPEDGVTELQIPVQPG